MVPLVMVTVWQGVEVTDGRPVELVIFGWSEMVNDGSGAIRESVIDEVTLETETNVSVGTVGAVPERVRVEIDDEMGESVDTGNMDTE